MNDMGAVEFWSRLIDALAWPVATVIAVWVLRRQIGSWVEKILGKAAGEVKAGPLSASWSPGGPGAEALADSAQDLVLESAPSTTIHSKTTATSHVTGVHTPTPEIDKRRMNVEALIDAAARWGWDQRDSNTFNAFPTPLISWDESERPYIVGGMPMNPGDSMVIPKPDGTADSRVFLPNPDLLAPPKSDGPR